MQIYSASRRQDMPVDAPKHLFELYHNALSSDSFWVFWTKNPANLLSMNLDYSRCALQLTVTGLGGTELEPGVPRFEDVLQSTAELILDGFNPELINWRFDPVIPGISSTDTMIEIAKSFSAFGVTRCITSFITWYGKVKDRWPEGSKTQRSETVQRDMILHMRDVLAEHNIQLYGCAQPHLDAIIPAAKCIDGEYYAQITGFEFDAHKDKSQRKACGCTESVDVGAYTKCSHGCKYCYARPA